MSARNPKQNKGSSRPSRSKTSVLTIAFAIAMAFFLVIGMVAIGITELVGRDNGQTTVDEDFTQSIEGQTDSEEQDLLARLEENPDDYQARSQLAVLLANTGRVDEAIRHYERALQLDSEDVALRMSFARALEQRGYDLDAEIQLERVLEADDENVEAMFMLGEILVRSDPPRREEADQLFEKVIETEPDSFYAQMAEERLADVDPGQGEDIPEPELDDTD